MIDMVKGFLREHGLLRSYYAPYNVMIGRSLTFEFLAWKIHEELAGADQAVEIV
jgi:hypothetical protein